jgi:hypothetical protein
MSKRLEIDWESEIEGLDAPYLDNISRKAGPLSPYTWRGVESIKDRYIHDRLGLGQDMILEDALMTQAETPNEIQQRRSDLFIARNVTMISENHLHFEGHKLVSLIGFIVDELDDSTGIVIYRARSFPQNRYHFYMPEIIAAANTRFENKYQSPFPNYPVKPS